MGVSTSKVIQLSQLNGGLPGITPANGQMFAESCAVCLDDQKHSSGVALGAAGKFNSKFTLEWPAVTDQMKRSHNDQEVATENGAYAIAFLIILELTNYTVIEKSRKGTGFDYRLGLTTSNLFQDTARLEVSGIRNGPNKVNQRVKQKQTQIKSQQTTDPCFVVVVEFSKPIAQVA